MKETDRIVIEWESTEVTKYRAAVSVDRFAELTGVPVADILAADDPEDVLPHAPLDLADELANIEDDGVVAHVEWDTFNREDIRVNVKANRR